MPITYFDAPDVKRLVEEMIQYLNFSHINPRLVYCFRSKGSKSRLVVARIHGFSRIWQAALKLPPAYIIEVISERYDKLVEDDQEKILIHELLHVPKRFSGGLRPHKSYFSRQVVERLQKKFGNREALIKEQ